MIAPPVTLLFISMLTVLLSGETEKGKRLQKLSYDYPNIGCHYCHMAMWKVSTYDVFFSQGHSFVLGYRVFLLSGKKLSERETFK